MGTNFKEWDKKANALTKALDAENEADKKEADEKLGLTGAVDGPPVAKAKEEMKKFDENTQMKRDIVAKMEAGIINFSSKRDLKNESITGVSNKAVKINDCEDCVLSLKEKAVKVFLESSKRVKLEMMELIASSVELYQVEDVHCIFLGGMAMVQLDATKNTILEWPDRDLTPPNFIVFSTCENLKIIVQGEEVGFEGCEIKPNVQCVAKYDAQKRKMIVEPVKRDQEKEFPTFLYEGGEKSRPSREEEVKVVDELSGEEKLAEAQKRKEEGNAAFKACDFMQATSLYTISIEMHPDPVVYSNRAQCWLKLGNFDRCIKDCEDGLALDEKVSKLHFRKGMALVALDKHMEALHSLGIAEKLEPSNKQITEAIGMVSMKVQRLQAASA